MQSLIRPMWIVMPLKTAKTKALSKLGALALAAFIFTKLNIDIRELPCYNWYKSRHFIGFTRLHQSYQPEAVR